MACNYCKTQYYIRTVQYSAPLLAPMTKQEEIRQQLLNLTGEVYARIANLYCPMCGAKVDGEDEGK